MKIVPVCRRLYDGVAVFSVANLLLLGSAVTYAVMTGAVTREKLALVGAVLRGDELIPKPKEKVIDQSPATETISQTSEIQSEDDLDLLRREAERIKTELDQQLALVHGMMLRVTAARDAFQQEKNEVAQREAKLLQMQRDEGLNKQLQIYEALAPKMAVQHLLGMEDVNEAARLLAAMEPRKAKAIVEAAKRGDQMTRMKLILDRIRDVAPAKSAELAEGES